MGKYIQDKKTGKMLGAEAGLGKDHVPTAGPRLATTVEDDADAYFGLQAATDLYGQRLRELAVNTDTELAQLYGEQQIQVHTLNRCIDSLHHDLGHRRPWWSAPYEQTTEDTLAEARTIAADPDYSPGYIRTNITTTLNTYDTAMDRSNTIRGRIRTLNDVYMQHRWNRAFLVPQGHVHSSMDCSTCNRQGSDTEFTWLPQYSGAEETQIVDDAGERACTVCYPSAPVDVLQRPTRIYSDDERQQLQAAEERRNQREAARTARAAKAPTATGEPLQIEVGTREWRGETVPAIEELKTERTAITYAVDTLSATLQGGERWMAPHQVADSRRGHVVDTIVSAVAEKRGVPETEVREEITKKAEAKIRKYLRERARYQS